MLATISVVVCCHNSASRLPKTLSHLADQSPTRGLKWEVLVIDNASTDGTADVARSVWPEHVSAPLRVIHEPRLGLSYARERGFSEARYEIVGFVDDDNYVNTDWVETVAHLMAHRPEVGACGGFVRAASELDLPWWFERFQGSYAVGPQAPGPGDVTWTRGFLWGAGLAVRKVAWDDVTGGGFTTLLTGRKGTQLAAGDDSEICYCLRLAGWKLWYDPRLLVAHSLPAGRLQWQYLRRLHRGFGASTVGLDPYRFASGPKPVTVRERLRQTWQWQALASIKWLLRRAPKLLAARRNPLEGDPEVLRLEWSVGRLQELLMRRTIYDMNIRAVRNAPWRKIGQSM